MFMYHLLSNRGKDLPPYPDRIFFALISMWIKKKKKISDNETA